MREEIEIGILLLLKRGGRGGIGRVGGREMQEGREKEKKKKEEKAQKFHITLDFLIIGQKLSQMMISSQLHLSLILGGGHLAGRMAAFK